MYIMSHESSMSNYWTDPWLEVISYTRMCLRGLEPYYSREITNERVCGTQNGFLKSKIPTNCRDFTMVHLIDLSWHQIEPSLYLMYEKLVALGFVYYDGEVRIVEPETERSERHV